ncbi:ribonuclease H-like domain-containing protein [Tanacetum coccineum]
MRLKSKALALLVDSSSPMVLVAESGNNRRSSSTPQVKSWKPCFNFAKGTCRFGDSCRYMHDANARIGTSYSGVNKERMNDKNTTNGLLTKLLNQLGNLGLHATVSNPPTNATPPVAFLASPSPTPSPPDGPTHLYPPGFALMAHATPSYYTAGPPSAPAQHVNTIPAQQFGVYSAPSPIPYAFLVSQHTWHQRLGHPGSDVLRRLVSNNVISCNKEKPPVLCHACQLGKHARLPFFVWVYPLVRKSDVLSKFILFCNYVRTQFKCEIRAFQCDHGGEFENRNLHDLFNTHGIQFRFSCPKTSQQNADDTLSRYKARLMANGNTQLKGVDVDETLARDLSKTVYMHQPLGFRDSTHPDYVCLLQRSLYGLKQAPRNGKDTAYLLLDADDVVLTTYSSDLFLGMFLSQKKYAVEILERACMVHCNPSRTHVDTESKLGIIGDVVSDPTLYRSLAGSLQYLTFTRPDISYTVQQDCLHIHDPREPHFSALKRILRKSTKRQPTLSRSSAEAEYRGVANVVAETCWLRNLLRELHTPLSSATLVYCDNVSAVYLSSNPVQHQRTKHIEIDIHFVCDLVATRQVRVLHVHSRYQFADIFTKGLPTALFEEFRSSLSVQCPPAQTVGEC